MRRIILIFSDNAGNRIILASENNLEPVRIWMNENGFTPLDIYSFDPYTDEMILTDINRIPDTTYQPLSRGRFYS